MHLLSLRVRVAVLVLVGVVPFLGFNLGSSYLNYRQDRIEAERRMLDIARGIALAIEGELRSRVAVLEVLALSGALARDDLVAFRAKANAVRARQEPGTHILLLRRDGQQLLNTALPPGASLPVRPGLDDCGGYSPRMVRRSPTYLRAGCFATRSWRSRCPFAGLMAAFGWCCR